MNRQLSIRIILNCLAAAFLIALTGEYGGTHLGIIETLEKQNYDWRIKRNQNIRNEDIVIVDIDRDTLRVLGDWPIARDHFAQLNEQLFKKYRVRVVAYSLPFTGRDDAAINLLADIEERFSSQFSGSQSFAFSSVLRRTLEDLRLDYDYDRRMTETLQANPVILGYVFDESGRVQGALPKPMDFMRADSNAIPEAKMKKLAKEWPSRRGYSGNLGEYLIATQDNAGHINFSADADGLIRRAPYFIRHAGGYYPSLPLVVYQQLYKQKDIIADIESGFLSDDSIGQLVLGNRKAPMGRDGSMYIRYMGDGGRNVDFASSPKAVFPYVSFIDVIKGRAPLDVLDDKIVFVGSSSEQLRLSYPTPVNPSLPGVEILATQLANLIDENSLQRSDSTSTYELMLLIAIGIGLSILFVVIGPVYSAIAMAAVIGGHIFFVLNAWDSDHSVWKIVPTLITVTGLFIINTIIGFIFEWRASRHLQSTFGQYVPPEFAKKIGTSGESINMEGEMRELSVLFSDVRNFTAISEQMSPRELTLMMNRMLTDLSQVIHQHDGTVDKYIGDAIMAFWNAPLHDDDHAKKAVLAAIDMQTAMNKLADELEKQGFEQIRLGVGICTGDANVGNMGSTLRMTYTAIGDTVNLASRTEGLTKYYRTPILVTQSTREKCGDDIAFRAVDLVRVKGRQEPVLLYQPIGLSRLMATEEQAVMEQFENMRQLYVAGDFQAAAEQLESYRLANPDDGLVEVYAERLETLLKGPAPEDWDGIMSHQTK